MRVFFLINRFLNRYKHIISAGILSGLALILIHTLVRYNAHSVSIIYYDSRIHVALTTWLANSYTAILFILFGSTTFLLPFFLLYSATLCMFKKLFAHEWDRWFTSLFFLFITCFTSALLPTISWRGVSINGGIIGSWIVQKSVRSHYIVAWLVASILILACLSVLTRMMIFLPFIYLTRASARWIKKTRPAHKIIHASFFCTRWTAKQIRSFVCWCYNLINITNLSCDKELNLSDEQQENMINLHNIVSDVFWQPKNTTEEKNDEAVPYTLPILAAHAARSTNMDEPSQQTLREQAHTLEQKLEHFNIQGTISAIKVGPVLTCFEYKPAIDTKLSRIVALEDDLALALKATSLRVVAPIPATNVVGFEVAHEQRRTVYCAQVMQHAHYQKTDALLPLIIGVDTIGTPIITDLTKMPHMLIAGSTGSGKSVLLNNMLMSLLCKKTPDELSMILIDPKRLEFASYANIPHLLFPIVHAADRAVIIFQWLAETMNKRYEQLARANARSIHDFHEHGGMPARMSMPYIVVVIDELADLMIVAGKHVESSLTRIAQMARAAGIHLIVATQRPSVDIITGLIKVNFPTRIALRVASAVDSRTIIDASGAEKLLGRGDLLMLGSQNPFVQRAHATYVSDEEIEQIVTHIKKERHVQYITETQLTSTNTASSVDPQDQYLYNEIISWLDDINEISISLLQRRFRIGYNRSARIIETLEQQGKIASFDGGKTRKVVRSE